LRGGAGVPGDWGMRVSTDNGQDQLSDAVKPQLEAIFALVGRWQARVQSEVPGEPSAGSSLRGDDDAAHPYEISYAVHGALVSAVDHLDALRALVADAHVVHARATFTLMRAAIENAATAVWLLGPSSRDERILRRLRLAWADSRDLEKAVLRAGQQPPLSKQGWKTKLETVAQARSMASAQIATITRDQPTFTSIVEAAGSDAGPEGLDSDLALVCWMVASGMAHARLWAALSSVLDRTDVPGASTPATKVMRLSASDTALAAIAQVATSMTAAGWRLYDQRRSDPRQPAT
jgi:hypothetical protein